MPQQIEPDSNLTSETSEEETVRSILSDESESVDSEQRKPEAPCIDEDQSRKSEGSTLVAEQKQECDFETESKFSVHEDRAHRDNDVGKYGEIQACNSSIGYSFQQSEDCFNPQGRGERIRTKNLCKRYVRVMGACSAEKQTIVETFSRGVRTQSDFLTFHETSVSILKGTHLKLRSAYSMMEDSISAVCEMTIPRFDNDKGALPLLKTKMLQSSNPQWDCSGNISNLCESEVVLFQVFDQEILSKTLIGEARLPMSRCFPRFRGELDLKAPEGQEQDFPERPGRITVLIQSESSKQKLVNIPKEDWGALITIVSASGMRQVDLLSENDPFCVCKHMFRGREITKFQTPVIYDDDNPVWEHSFLIGDIASQDDLQFEVFDDDDGILGRSSELLGMVTMNCSKLLPKGFDDTVLSLQDSIGGGEGNPVIAIAAVALNTDAMKLYRQMVLVEEETAKQEELAQEAARQLELDKIRYSALLDFKTESLEVQSMWKALMHETEKDLSNMLQKSETSRREQYRFRLLERRLKRLRSLDPTSFSQLPILCIEASRDGDVKFVVFCCQAGVYMDVQDRQGLTPLIVAGASNKVSVVIALLENKVDPNIQDFNGATCSHYAVQLEHIHVVTALLDWEAFDSFTIKDAAGKTAIDYARRPDRETTLRHIRIRMGGPRSMLCQLWRSAMLDRLGVPRQSKAFWTSFWNLLTCDKTISKAQPILQLCAPRRDKPVAEEGAQPLAREGLSAEAVEQPFEKRGASKEIRKGKRNPSKNLRATNTQPEKSVSFAQ